MFVGLSQPFTNAIPCCPRVACAPTTPNAMNATAATRPAKVLNPKLIRILLLPHLLRLSASNRPHAARKPSPGTENSVLIYAGLFKLSFLNARERPLRMRSPSRERTQAQAVVVLLQAVE